MPVAVGPGSRALALPMVPIGGVAQSEERRPFKPTVVGSRPTAPTTNYLFTAYA
jgi:hypothetical protein